MTQHSYSYQISTEPGQQPGSLFHDKFMSLAELDLADHFLIAMPSVKDPMFGGTVIYMCEHNERGALGVIINKPTDMNVETLFQRIHIDITNTPETCSETKKLVMFGGPVQDDRGFVLHLPMGDYTSTIHISDQVSFTTSRDVLDAVAQGRGPKRLLVSVGYAGWGAGQLEDEILRNDWLTVPADPAIIFELPIELRLAAAIKLLGFDPLMLSGEAGHA